MGQFLYGTPPAVIEIEDRTLAHLQIVIYAKFRRDERFSLTLDSMPEGARGRHSFWMNPNIALQFHFAGSRQPTINPTWVELLMDAANSGGGLRLLTEPPS
ncbi:ATP-dependent DNA ligase [Rathayibacter rathayi]|jgi:hypothetical protein|uniref:DUF7882 domain-containing protein n=2 Tax=Rathayibacter TaxID=33886 RepID=A0A169BRF9_9MICO|nr:MULTISPECIES: hypothetical protein [Rathayibacter]AND15215.1 hypothetical protein A6122_0045 [Rathayibacter tritici]AZZ50045.1 ATP-dependent DNA ligase [Rathayibacter rathayi]MWV75705.1 ATP-dependent DNA ligase [Rathayibacter rathayi NCPPB 2980 = VKM Ac-1601]PPF10088.1 ATP-dependent DNA ligase [Rathayibacter rathayi]PPF10533.1 ATP-dependent DNA ligase [Rathayibacter sp. AY1A5]